MTTEAIDSTATETLWTALLAVQAEAVRLQKDAEATVTSAKGSYKYRYLTLAKLSESVLPLLTRHGLLWLTRPSEREGRGTLLYSLHHVASGGHIDGEMSLALSNPTPQAQGGAITFARRYALMTVLNLVPTETDDDGKRASTPAPRKVSAAGRAKIQEAILAAGIGGPEIPLLLASAGVLARWEDITTEDAQAIRRELDKRNA